MFLGFRPFNWKILVKSNNKRVWSPKTKATWTFMNVVIWQKKVYLTYIVIKSWILIDDDTVCQMDSNNSTGPLHRIISWSWVLVHSKTSDNFWCSTFYLFIHLFTKYTYVLTSLIFLPFLGQICYLFLCQNGGLPQNENTYLPFKCIGHNGK